MKVLSVAVLLHSVSAISPLSLTTQETELHRKHIVASVNGNSASTWRAVYPPASRFAGQDYSVLRSMAGVLGTPGDNEAGLKVKTLADMQARDIPESFNAQEAWPQCPIIAEIRDQSACGSCYAVSAASVATDRYCIHHNGTSMDRLSAVDLMSCCKTCAGANGGCYGGSPGHCWDYMASQGITTGGDYGDFSECLAYPFPKCEHHVSGTFQNCSDTPYNAPTCFWQCDPNTTSKVGYDASQAAHKFTSSYQVDANVEAIQTEIMNHGPVQASMFLVPEFEVYHSGVFSTTNSDYIGAHAIRIVGWGTETVPYWIVANSWNAEWGEAGYFRIMRGANNLAIEQGVVAGSI